MRQLMYSFNGTTPPPEIIGATGRGEVAAICLFAHANVRSPAQVGELTTALRQAALEGGHLPPIIGIDQEGGQLIAITTGATALPGNMALGATRSPELAEQAGKVLGRELLAMGLTMNFAPSVDVNVNPDNPVVGVRSFGDDPALVAELGAAMIRGIQSEGVLATAKHFPGHGDTAVDSHHDMQVVQHSIERMHDVELRPFRAAIYAGVKAIMTAHILYSALDDRNPVSLSKAILNGLLRQEMGFNGLIITDAMDMGAVSRLGERESVEAALNAGTDLVLLGHLKNQLSLGQNTRDLQREDSLARIRDACQFAPPNRPPFAVVGCAEHQQIAQQIADHSITVVRDEGLLPLTLRPSQQIGVITVTPTDLTPADTSSGVKIQLAENIRRRHDNILSLEMPYRASDETIRGIVDAIRSSRVVVIGTIQADQDPSQAKLVQMLCECGKDSIVVALRTPYDLRAFPMVRTYLCAYGIRAVTVEAVARVLFGEIDAKGVLPCAIPGITDNR